MMLLMLIIKMFIVYAVHNQPPLGSSNPGFKSNKRSKASLQQNMKAVAEAITELKDLESRLKGCSLLEKDELLVAAAPILSKLVGSLQTSPSIPLDFVSCLLTFFSKNPNSVCQILAFIKDKRMLKPYKKNIADLYSSNKQHCYQLFRACQVYDDGLCEKLIEDLCKIKTRIRAEAAALANSNKKSLDLSISEDGLQCVPLMAGMVSLQLSYRLVGILVDLFVITKNTKLLEMAEVLIIAAPCRHPLLPVVLSLMSSVGLCTRTMDLIVHPRRAASIKARQVVFEPESPVVDVVGVDKPDNVVSAVNMPILTKETFIKPLEDPQKHPIVEPLFQPNVTKKVKKVDEEEEDDDNFPEFFMEGPDE